MIIRLVHPNSIWLDKTSLSVFTLLSHCCSSLLIYFLWYVVGSIKWFYWLCSPNNLSHWFVCVCCLLIHSFFLSWSLINSRTSIPPSLYALFLLFPYCECLTYLLANPLYPQLILNLLFLSTMLIYSVLLNFPMMVLFPDLSFQLT